MQPANVTADRGSAASVAPPVVSPLSGGTLRRQIVQYAPAVLLPAVVSVGSAAIFTRVFAASEYGRFTLAWSVGTVVILLSSQWLQQGITRFVPATEPGPALDRLKGAIALALVAILLITTTVGMVVTAIGAATLPTPWPRDVAAGSAMVIATSLFGPLGAMLQAEMRPGPYSAFVGTSSVLRLLFGLGLVFLVVRDPAALLWAQAAAVAVVMPPLWRAIAFPSLARLRSEWRARWDDVRPIAAYGIPVVGFTIAATLLDVSDRWVIQYFRGTAQSGIYSANYSLVMGTVGLVALPMLLAAHPFLMRAWANGDRETAGRWLGRIVEWYLVAGALVIGVGALFARDVADLLLGAEFREGHRIIPLVLAGMIVWQLGMYSHKPLEFAGRTRQMFALCMAATALNVLVNIAVVPRYGYMGAAATSLGAYAFYTVVVTVMGRAVLPWSVRWTKVLPSLLLGVSGLLLTASLRGAIERTIGSRAGLACAVGAAATVSVLALWRQALPMLRGAPATRDG